MDLSQPRRMRAEAGRCGWQVRAVVFPAGSKESLFSCTLTASEEAMAVLEEVVLYSFQQCVYYLSKVPRGLTPDARAGVMGDAPDVPAGPCGPEPVGSL